MGARREVVSAVAEDELCATTGWHRKHAVRALRRHETVTLNGIQALRERRRRYGATIKDALTALLGGVGSRVWQAAQRDDPDLAAGT